MIKCILKSGGFNVGYYIKDSNNSVLLQYGNMSCETVRVEQINVRSITIQKIPEDNK